MITGPFSLYTVNYNQTRMVQRKWYRQSAPYRLPLPLESHTAIGLPYVNPWGDYGTGRGVQNYAFSVYESPHRINAYNKAYSEFKEKVQDGVDLAVNIAERKQSADMMLKRLTQMVSFGRHMAAFRFREAAAALGVRFVPTKTKLAVTKGRFYRYSSMGRYERSREVTLKRNLKSFGNNYLEFHFGWEPLVKDIGKAIEISHDDITLANGLKIGKATLSDKPDLGIPPSIGMFSVVTTYNWRTSVRVSAEISIENRNLANLNRLGFINPAVVAWELVPFSFIVDWFVNVGDVLSSYSDFAGVSLQKKQTTVFNTVVDTLWYRHYAGTFPRNKRRSFYVSRSLNIAGPAFSARGLKLPSLTRALTMCSLLTIGLGRK